MLVAVRTVLRIADSSFAGSVFAGSVFAGSPFEGSFEGTFCEKAATANRITTIRLGVFIRQYYIGKMLRFSTKPTAEAQKGAETRRERHKEKWGFIYIPVFIRVHSRPILAGPRLFDRHRHVQRLAAIRPGGRNSRGHCTWRRER